MALNLKNLVSKLNETTRTALEGAAALCVSRGHFHIEIEHYLSQIIQVHNADFARICVRFEVDSALLQTDLDRTLATLDRGNTRSPAFSPALLLLLRDAWCVGSIDFGASKIRSGFTLLALLDPDNHHELPAELRKLNAAAIAEQFQDTLRKSVESD